MRSPLSPEAIEASRERLTHIATSLYVREGAVLPTGSRTDRPDYDYLDGLVLAVYPANAASADRLRTVSVTTPDGRSADFTIVRTAGKVRVTSGSGSPWSVKVSTGGDVVGQSDGEAIIQL